MTRRLLTRLLGGAADSGIVDQHTETFLFGRDLLDELLDILLGRDIGGDGDDLAGNVLAVNFSDFVEFL